MFFNFSFKGSPSPAKSRPSLPTSPTHMQAMRHATHQKQFCGSNLNTLLGGSSASALQSQNSPNSMNFQTPSSQNSPVSLGIISPTGSDIGIMIAANQQQQQQQLQHQQQQQQNKNSAIMQSIQQQINGNNGPGMEFSSAGLDLNSFCGSPGKLFRKTSKWDTKLSSLSLKDVLCLQSNAWVNIYWNVGAVLFFHFRLLMPCSCNRSK